MSVKTLTERTSAEYTATLKDAAGIVLPLTAIDTATLTFKDVKTGTVINSRTAQNIKNTNNDCVVRM